MCVCEFYYKYKEVKNYIVERKNQEVSEKSIRMKYVWKNYVN